DPELAISMADQSDYLILVMEMSVLGIRNAKALITSLLANGFTESKIRVVANRYEPRRSSISIDDATEALNGIPVHAFPNDYRVVSRSANLGKPVADVSPRSKFRKAIISLVDAITPKTSRSA
ncbi:MAG: Flp pilus assembly CpaE family ATPase, partial [Planctomycetota bacterium]